MLKRALMLLALIMFGTTLPILTFKTLAAPATLRVPTDFPTIQKAIDSANPGDTIFVYNGTYTERILVQKTLVIVGQSSEVTTIYGDGLGTVVNITGSGVSISNFSIKNGGPSEFDGGISLSLASGCSVFGNKITGNGVGVLLVNASGNVISNNTIVQNSDYGIESSNSSGNKIFNNNFVDNTVQVVSSNSTNVWDNGYPSGGNYWSNYVGVDVKRGPNQDQPGSDGIMDSAYIIDADNVDRYPFFGYWRPRIVKNLDTGISYDGIQKAIDAPETLIGNTILVYGGVYYENVVVHKRLRLLGVSLESIIDGGGWGTVVKIASNRVSVSGLTLRNSGSNPSDSALLLDSVSSVGIGGSVLMGSSIGLYVNNSYACVVEGNTVSNDVAGVDLDYSHDNTLRANNLTDLGSVGFSLRYSNSNIIEQNMVHTSRDGLVMENSFNNQFRQNVVADIASYSLHLLSSRNNEFSGNKITYGYIALLLESGVGNMIAGNEISNSRLGVYLISSANNTIYYNNFIENVFQAVINPSSGPNNWNMTYPIGGNYWRGTTPSGTYTGADDKRGPHQNETGSDGIGDTSFTPDSTSPGDKDYYPQMQAVNLTAAVDIHDVAVRNVFFSTDRIYRGGFLNVTVLVSNVGNYTETFAVTAYYNASVVATGEVRSLRPRSGLNLTFVWNTTGVTAGTYSISANATAVPEEENLQNNQFVGGKVTVIFYRDVAVSTAAVSSTVAYPSGTVNVTALVSNLGEVSENLTVGAAYDENLIGSRTINGLAAHANASVTFSWKTSGVVTCRSYNVTVKVDPVPDEAVLGDNVLQAGRVNVRIVGDVNGDGVVDILDITVIAVRFNSRVGDVKYDLLFDLDSDGVINIMDIALAARNFLRTCQ